MTIAVIQTGTIGPRCYEAQGPFTGQGPSPSSPFKYGEVAMGDAEAEYVYCSLTIAAGVFLPQGTLVSFDNNYAATLLTTGAATVRGQGIGTLWFGGRYGDAAPAAYVANLSIAGTYGVWVQRNGISLVSAASTAAAGNLLTTTATSGQADAPATPLAGSKTIRGAFVTAASATFTGSTTNGSPTITLPSSLLGVYPGQSITGPGIPANSFIGAINGIPGGYTISLSSAISGGSPVNATATASGVSLTVNGFVEAYLRRPYIDNTN